MNLNFPMTKLARLSCILALLWSLQAGAVQNGDSRIDAEELSATISNALSNDTLDGASLLLIRDDEVLYKEAFGTLGPDDRVKIASSTKPVAAVSILRLIDDAILGFDDTLGHWLPEFRGTAVENATLQQLLSHTSGIGEYRPNGFPSEGTLAEFSELIASQGRLRSPGNFNYSGVGMDIACRIAEVASAMPYEEYLDSRLLQPLGMSDTVFNIAADPSTVSAIELARGEGRYISCGSGIESTLDDMGIFFKMLAQRGNYNGTRYLSDKTYGEMIRRQSSNPRLDNDPYTTGEYGLGLYRDRVAQDGSAITISHGGALGTMPWIDLDSGLVGVFFSQDGLSDARPLISEIQEEVRSETAESPIFSIQAGLNDAWYNPGTPGQGFFIVVWENVQTVFLAWFTYDVERPESDIEANLGEPGHRWLTAQGSYAGDTAELDLFLTSGGVFDSATPPVSSSEKQGTLQIRFTDCNAGMISYDIPAFSLSGTIPIERVALDNLVLCE